MSKVFVKIIAARNLKRGDLFSSDPFVELQLRSSRQIHKSKVLKKTLNPYWNEDFTLLSETPENDSLIIRVWDYDKYTKNDYLGEVEIPLNKFIWSRGQLIEEWIPLRNRNRPGKGEIHVGVAIDPSTPYQPVPDYIQHANYYPVAPPISSGSFAPSASSALRRSAESQAYHIAPNIHPSAPAATSPPMGSSLMFNPSVGVSNPIGASSVIPPPTETSLFPPPMSSQSPFDAQQVGSGFNPNSQQPSLYPPLPYMDNLRRSWG